MTNNDLPYKTGNSTPYSVTAYMGKEPKKKKVYIFHFAMHYLMKI